MPGRLMSVMRAAKEEWCEQFKGVFGAIGEDEGDARDAGESGFEGLGAGGSVFDDEDIAGRCASGGVCHGMNR